MSTNETRSQDSAAIIITGDNAEVTDDALDWEEPFTRYDYYDEPTEYDYVRHPVCKAEALGGKTLATSHRPTCHYE